MESGHEVSQSEIHASQAMEEMLTHQVMSGQQKMQQNSVLSHNQSPDVGCKQQPPQQQQQLQGGKHDLLINFTNEMHSWSMVLVHNYNYMLVCFSTWYVWLLLEQEMFYRTLISINIFCTHCALPRH